MRRSRVERLVVHGAGSRKTAVLRAERMPPVIVLSEVAKSSLPDGGAIAAGSEPNRRDSRGNAAQGRRCRARAGRNDHIAEDIGDPLEVGGLRLAFKIDGFDAQS